LYRRTCNSSPSVDIGVLPAGAWSGRGAAEIDQVLGDERPIAVDDEWLQFPVLGSIPAKPYDMGRLAVSSIMSELRQLWAKALIDEELHSLSCVAECGDRRE
jgi:hypothetical protein